MISDLDAARWELIAATALTILGLSLVTWWGLLEWLDQRAARRPARWVPRHTAAGSGERTRKIYPNRYRRPFTAADLDEDR